MSNRGLDPVALEVVAEGLVSVLGMLVEPLREMTQADYGISHLEGRYESPGHISPPTQIGNRLQ